MRINLVRERWIEERRRRKSVEREEREKPWSCVESSKSESVGLPDEEVRFKVFFNGESHGFGGMRFDGEGEDRAGREVGKEVGSGQVDAEASMGTAVS